MLAAARWSLTRKEDSLLAAIAFDFVKLESFKYSWRPVGGDKRVDMETDHF